MPLISELFQTMKPQGGIWTAFAAALLNCFANGFIYTFSIFSTRLASQTGISRSDIVILGLLSQAGLGILQYPTTLLLNHAHKNGVSHERLDTFLAYYGGFLLCTATAGIGAVMFVTEQGTTLSYSTTLAILGICFFLWGQAVGSTFNSCTTVITFNTQGNTTLRRRQLVTLSLSVGVGGVWLVVLYHFAIREMYALSTFFFGTCIFYACCMVIRVSFMARLKHKVTPVSMDAEDEEQLGRSSPATPPAVSPAITPQPLSVLLKSDIVWLCCLGTFLGVGVGGTFLSSLGNLGSKLVPDLDITFSLTLTFLVMQTLGRLVNALAYGLGDWPYIFAFWQAFCLVGICAFLISPTEIGAFVSCSFVGMSFGGFHSSFPILAATTFPGNPTVDYSQSIGVALAVSSVGCIAVGQLTTVVYKAASLEDLRHSTGFFGTFLFFVALILVSTLSAVILGRKIIQKRRSSATSSTNLVTLQERDGPVSISPSASNEFITQAENPQFVADVSVRTSTSST